MKRFGSAMGMQLLAWVVYGLAVVDMLFYPGSDLRTIVGMILAARVIEAVAGMVAGSKRSQELMVNTIAEIVLEKIERQGKLASTAEVSRRYNGLDIQTDGLCGLVDATLNRQFRLEAEVVAKVEGLIRRRTRRTVAEEG